MRKTLARNKTSLKLASMHASDTTGHNAIDSLYKISRLVSNTEDPKEALDLILEVKQF